MLFIILNVYIYSLDFIHQYNLVKIKFSSIKREHICHLPTLYFITWLILLHSCSEQHQWVQESDLEVLFNIPLLYMFMLIAVSIPKWICLVSLYLTNIAFPATLNCVYCKSGKLYYQLIFSNFANLMNSQKVYF